MLALAASGTVTEGTWLRAERQTAGRGRQGRAWVSEPGNLYASTIVRLRAVDAPAPGLAFVAGVALAAAIATLGSREGGSLEPQGSAISTLGSRLRGSTVVALKWPNDLLLNGAKVAGILLERQGDTVVAGFGVNCAHHPDLPDRPTTSLADAGHPIAPATLVTELAAAFARWLAIWQGRGFAPVRARWLEVAHPVGTPLSARLPDGTTVDGQFDGLDTNGALILRLAGGQARVIHAGDVFLI